MEQANRDRTFVACMGELDTLEREEAAIKERKKDIFKSLKDAHFDPKEVRTFRRRMEDPEAAQKHDEAQDEMMFIWERRATIKAGTVHAPARDARERVPHDPETDEITEHRPVEEIAADIAVMATTNLTGAAAVLAVAQAVAEPEPPKPHILTPSERDPLWEFEHRGMVDAASGQHRIPTDIAGEQLAAWQKGHDEKMAAIRERAA